MQGSWKAEAVQQDSSPGQEEQAEPELATWETPGLAPLAQEEGAGGEGCGHLLRL